MMMMTTDRVNPAQQHLFHYQRFQIDKSQPLGRGAYGVVYKANCDQLPCAAKVLHPTILDPMDPGADKIMERFRQECALLESIRHPNIVQYLAMAVDPESRLPVLLMELLDENLTKMLECSPQSLAYCIQVDICHDVALANAYLHTCSIIHRDLSSNNVLIIAGRGAKVTDFGMSKLSDAAPTMTPLTMCPGTLAYMPPEALREPPRYTKKIDCFAEGVIMIQICTGLWPKPGPRTQSVPFSASPTGMTEVPVLEPERRKNHIDLIDPNHALLPIAMDCLKYDERERPSSEELCQRLTGLKNSNHYRDSVRQHQGEIQAKDIQIMSQNQQLLEKDRALQDKERVIREKDTALQVSDKVIQDTHRVLASRKRQIILLNQQLQVQEQVTAEIQQTNHSLQRQVKLLLRQLSQQLPKNTDHKPHQQWVRLNWRDGGKAPSKKNRGAAVVNGNVAYFVDETCSCYDLSHNKWSELPKCPYRDCTLAVVSGQLTAIGGCRENVYTYKNKLMTVIGGHREASYYTYTNKLLTLCDGWLHRGWSDVFPPMPTRRYGTIAVTSKKHLIVAGGATGLDFDDYINTVEVMDTKTLVWSTVASLPHPYKLPSATICGDHLYMLGGYDDKGKTKSVLTCSLTELLQSSSSSSSSVWYRVADAPAYLSTCAAVNGQLLAVGGCDEYLHKIAAIQQYNPRTNSWDHISDIETARFSCHVAVFPTNEVMVVGGWISICSNTDEVDIASFS